MAKVIRGWWRFIAAGLDRAPARPAGVSEEPTFRMGRAHDRIVVAEVARTASSSWKCAATGDRCGARKRNATGATPRRDERPYDGRRSGSSVLAASVTGRRRRVVSAARSQTPLTWVRGSPPAGRKPARQRAKLQGRQAERGDGSVRGCSSVDVAGRKRPRRKAGTESSEVRGAS